MRFNLIIILSLFFISGVYAQVEIDKPVILNGTVSSDKQIENVAEPDSLNKIITANTIQKNAGRFGIAAGTDSLQLTINSGIQFYTPGNLFYFQVTGVNTGPVNLSVNGLPFSPLHVLGFQELKSGQLKPGQMYCAIFSGQDFQLLSAVNNDCRVGFVEVNPTYCMEINERAPSDLWQAIIACNNDNTRLCKWGEWYYACQKSGSGLMNMVGNWEWTDDAGDSRVRVAGTNSCSARSVFLPTNVLNYRCCYSK